MAMAKGEESEMNDATGQMTPPPRAASTVYDRSDDDGDVHTDRPTPLVIAWGTAARRGAH